MIFLNAPKVLEDVYGTKDRIMLENGQTRMQKDRHKTFASAADMSN